MNSEFLRKLYQKQAKMIYFYLIKNSASHEDAEDIVQQSYLNYMFYSKGVDSDKALAYIFTIALNEFRKQMRNKGHEQIVSIDHAYFWNNFSNEEDPEKELLIIEKTEEIMVVLEKMKETFRTLIKNETSSTQISKSRGCLLIS